MSNGFPFSDPVGISRHTAQSIGLEAIDHRRGQGGLSAPMYGNTFGTISGVFPGGTTGQGPSNDLACTGTSGLVANFNAGHYACDRGTGNLYLGMAYAGWSVTLDAGDAVNPRIDAVVIRNRDPGGLDYPGTGITESARPTILKGTPAASPSRPTGQLTSGDVVLAYLTVGGGSNANQVIAVNDARLFVVARGAIGIRTAWDTRPGAYEGDFTYNLVNKSLDVWDGDGWVAVASPAVWTAFTPRLYADSGECYLGNTGSAFGRYIVTGKIMHIRMEFRAQIPGCNMGTGYITTRIPGGYKSAKLRESHIHCKLNSMSLGNGPQSIWLGDLYIPPDSTMMGFYFPTAKDNVQLNAYRVASQAGQAGGSIPYIPNGYADPYILTLQGTYEVQ